MTNGGGRHSHKDKKKNAAPKKSPSPVKRKPKDWVEKAVTGNGKGKE